MLDFHIVFNSVIEEEAIPGHILLIFCELFHYKKCICTPSFFMKPMCVCHLIGALLLVVYDIL
jgi:hypothetical protein